MLIGRQLFAKRDRFLSITVAMIRFHQSHLSLEVVFGTGLCIMLAKFF
jgi:hypothetical protein